MLDAVCLDGFLQGQVKSFKRNILRHMQLHHQPSASRFIVRQFYAFLPHLIEFDKTEVRRMKPAHVTPRHSFKNSKFVGF